MDKGFTESDKILERLERQIHKEYRQASKEMTEKATSYFKKFAKEDAKKRSEYESGAISKKDYIEWRKRKMLQGKYYDNMKRRLTNDMVNTDKIAMGYVYDKVIDTYALNFNFGTYLLEKDSQIDTSFTLYNRDAVLNLVKNNPDLLPKNTNPKVDIPKDKRWNSQHIQSAVSQSILQGESIDDLAKRLQNVTDMDERSAIRNARTAMTSAQNAGRMDSMKRAKARGIGVKKGWMATLDAATRDSHRRLDGEVRDLNEEFSNGLQFPADPNGAPAEVYNCRCRLTHEYEKYDTDWSKLENRRSELGSMSYETWKQGRRAMKGIENVSKQGTPKAIEPAINLKAYKNIADLKSVLAEDDFREFERALYANKGDDTALEYYRKIQKGDVSNESINNILQRADVDKAMGEISKPMEQATTPMPFSKNTLKSIDDYLEGAKSTFTKGELDEIKTHMALSETTLYRVEDMSWMADGLKVGDSFEFDKPIKSFTHDYSTIKTIISEGDDAGLYESSTVAVFKTEGKVNQLDVSIYSRNHADENESFAGGRFKVIKIENGESIYGYKTKIYHIEELSDEEVLRKKKKR